MRLLTAILILHFPVGEHGAEMILLQPVAK